MRRLRIIIFVAVLIVATTLGFYFWSNEKGTNLEGGADLCAFPVGQVPGQSEQVAIQNAFELVSGKELNVSFAQARSQDARAIPALLRLLEEQSGSPTEPKIIQLLSYMGAAELLPRLEQVLRRPHGSKMTFDEFGSVIAAIAAHGHLAAAGCDQAFDFLDAATHASYWNEIGYSGAYGSNTEDLQVFELRCQVIFAIAATRCPRGLELLRKLERTPPAFSNQDEARLFRDRLKAAVEHYHELVNNGPKQVWKNS